MNEYLRDIPLDFSKWELYGTVDPFIYEGVSIPGLRQDCYQIEMDGELISAGVFEYNGKRTHVAWGVKSEPHCSFNSIADEYGKWESIKEGCPEYEILKDNDHVSGFILNGIKKYSAS